MNIATNVALVKWYDRKHLVLASTHFGVDPVGSCKKWSKKEVCKCVLRPDVVAEYLAAGEP